MGQIQPASLGGSDAELDEAARMANSTVCDAAQPTYHKSTAATSSVQTTLQAHLQ